MTYQSNFKPNIPHASVETKHTKHTVATAQGHGDSRLIRGGLNAAFNKVTGDRM